jgi:hypothetical protein
MAEVQTSFIKQHQLGLKLSPLMVGELYLAQKLLHPVYVYRNGIFTPVAQPGSIPSKDLINTLLRNSYRTVFAHREDLNVIKGNLETALIKVTRSLSVGDPLENGSKDIKLLSLNLGSLYQNPHNDDLLKLQYQSTQNLSKFLLENKKIQPLMFQTLHKENFHFTVTQPMLSSLLLLSFLQAIHLFHDREIENLFLTSYLKDIGISMIPEEKYGLKVLTSKDQNLFANHADYSFDLLEGRLPLSKNHLAIIKHHHFLNDKIKRLVSKDSARGQGPEMIYGIESTLVAVFDILVAMTNERPYRKGVTLYQSLEVIKKMMADEFPQEFRALVVFLKHFYKF